MRNGLATMHRPIVKLFSALTILDAYACMYSRDKTQVQRRGLELYRVRDIQTRSGWQADAGAKTF